MRIENKYFNVSLDKTNGTVTSIFDKQGRLNLRSDSKAGIFRIQLSCNNSDQDCILGKEQSLSSYERTTDGIIFHWDGPLKSTSSKRIDIDVVMNIVFNGCGLEFQLNVQNNSPFDIVEVRYPFISGLLNIGSHESKEIKLFAPCGEKIGYDIDSWAWELYKPFRDYNFPYPVGRSWHSSCPDPYLFMPWIDIYNPRLDRGIYIGMHDTVIRTKVLNIGQVKKKSAENGIIASLVHFPYTKPSEYFKGSPFVLQFHEGGWKQAGKIYRNWFLSQFPLSDPKKDWMRQSSAIQYLMFLLPEGNVIYKFKDIPKIASEAKKYGTDLMISGWHHGGHDNGYPWYEPDPRLGTYEDLEAGIKACHKIGMKVSFFANIQPVTLACNRYKEVKKYLWTNIKGDSGEETRTTSFGMGTLGARMGFTPRRMVWGSPGLAKFREILVHQFRKLAEIGADGIHFDKCMGADLDFNPGLLMSPDQAGTGGMIKCLEEIYSACRVINPDFCFTWEWFQDRILSFGGITWWQGGQPPMKWIFPEWAGSLPVQNLHDFAIVNHAFKYGHQLLVQFGRGSHSMGSRPYKWIAEYVGEINRIREELKETIFLGEYLEKDNVHIKNQSTGYSVFRNMDTGKRACILENDLGSSIKTEIISFKGNKNGKVRIYLPFQETIAAGLPVKFTIPPEQVAVVVEE